MNLKVNYDCPVCGAKIIWYRKDNDQNGFMDEDGNPEFVGYCSNGECDYKCTGYLPAYEIEKVEQSKCKEAQR